VKLSIVIPAYNEAKTIVAILKKVMALSVEKEIIVVDDGSTDGTGKILEDFIREKRGINLIRHNFNRGKGAAVRSALEKVSGDVVVIQDADLEYEPEDLLKMLKNIEKGKAVVVYGSRVLGKGPMSYLRYYLGGRFLSMLTNILCGSAITDEPTCYKMFKREILEGLKLRSEGFEFCPEVTAKVLRRGYNIVEVPIRYNPRKIKEGKKIRWWDGLKAIFTLIRFRFFD